MKQFQIHNRAFLFKGDNFKKYFCVDTLCDYSLNVKEISYVRLDSDGHLPLNWQDKVSRTSDIHNIVTSAEVGELSGPYKPVNDMPTLDTVIPNNMDEVQEEALSNFRNAVGDVAEFLCAKLKMSYSDLENSLRAEQVDGAALAIYNIEARHESLIIGDQTGIGKGRQAAAVIRYSLANGITPIFMTVKASLFSDMYRDCLALGSGKGGDYPISPMVFNSNASIVDFSKQKEDFEESVQEDGESDEHFEERKLKIMANSYEVAFGPVNKNAFKHKELPDKCNCVFATYSQFSTSEEKRDWLTKYTQNHKCVFIFDEAHTAAGEKSNVGIYLRTTLKYAYGCMFLSATFAKSAETLGFFVQKTISAESRISPKQLRDTLVKGGNSIQETISQELVRCGQLVRRERVVKGSHVEYITPTKASEFHLQYDVEGIRGKADQISEIMRKLVGWNYEAQGKETKVDDDELIYIRDTLFNNGFEKVNIECRVTTPLDYAFGLCEALLLAVKADVVTRRAIYLVKHGKKVVIALSKTAESLIRDFDKGTKVNGDFARFLTNICGKFGRSKYIVKEVTNEQPLLELGFEQESETDKGKTFVLYRDWSPTYLNQLQKIIAEINSLTTGIPCSPIDAISKMLNDEGIKFYELTGRKKCLQYTDDKFKSAVVCDFKRPNSSVAVNDFQNNRCDVLIINQSAATGLSCHAVETNEVPLSEVKQRYMLLVQPELDVNIEVQKMGRINRTGQVETLPPQYEYIMSGIPMEDRMTLMLKSKLSRLNSLTSSDRHAQDDFSNGEITQNVDFYNHYGDEVVADWARSHPDEFKYMGLKLGNASAERVAKDFAKDASARIFILPCKEQELYYKWIINTYLKRKDELTNSGEWDLEVQKIQGAVTYVEDTDNPAIINVGRSKFFGGNVNNGYISWTEKHRMTFEKLKSEFENLAADNWRNLDIIANTPLDYGLDPCYRKMAVDALTKMQGCGTFLISYRKTREMGITGNYEYTRTNTERDRTGLTAILGFRPTLNKFNQITDIEVITCKCYQRQIIYSVINKNSTAAEFINERYSVMKPANEGLWGGETNRLQSVLTGNIISAVNTGDDKSHTSLISCDLKNGGSLLFVPRSILRNVDEYKPYQRDDIYMPLTADSVALIKKLYVSNVKITSPLGSVYVGINDYGQFTGKVVLKDNESLWNSLSTYVNVTLEEDFYVRRKKTKRFYFVVEPTILANDWSLIVSSDSLGVRKTLIDFLNALPKNPLWPRLAYNQADIPTTNSIKKVEQKTKKSKALDMSILDDEEELHFPAPVKKKGRNTKPLDMSILDDEEELHFPAPVKKKGRNTKPLDMGIFDDEEELHFPAPIKKKGRNTKPLDMGIFDDEEELHFPAPVKKKGRNTKSLDMSIFDD